MPILQQRRRGRGAAGPQPAAAESCREGGGDVEAGPLTVSGDCWKSNTTGRSTRVPLLPPLLLDIVVDVLRAERDRDTGRGRATRRARTARRAEQRRSTAGGMESRRAMWSRAAAEPAGRSSGQSRKRGAESEQQQEAGPQARDERRRASCSAVPTRMSFVSWWNARRFAWCCRLLPPCDDDYCSACPLRHRPALLMLSRSAAQQRRRVGHQHHIILCSSYYTGETEAASSGTADSASCSSSSPGSPSQQQQHSRQEWT